MGEIIHMDTLRIKREEKLREYALSVFPWVEMEQVKVQWIEPLSLYWSPSRKWFLLELCYRLVFEAFVCGLEAARERKKTRFIPQSRSDRFTAQHQAICQKLIEKLTTEFDAFQWLDEWSAEAVFILLDELAKNWFMKGFHKKR